MTLFLLLYSGISGDYLMIIAFTQAQINKKLLQIFGKIHREDVFLPKS